MADANYINTFNIAQINQPVRLMNQSLVERTREVKESLQCLLTRQQVDDCIIHLNVWLEPLLG